MYKNRTTYLPNVFPEITDYVLKSLAHKAGDTDYNASNYKYYKISKTKKIRYLCKF